MLATHVVPDTASEPLPLAMDPIPAGRTTSAGRIAPASATSMTEPPVRAG